MTVGKQCKFQSGDVVEIISGGMASRIGIVEVTPGWETIGVNVGVTHIRKKPSDLSLLRAVRQ